MNCQLKEFYFKFHKFRLGIEKNYQNRITVCVTKVWQMEKMATHRLNRLEAAMIVIASWFYYKKVGGVAPLIADPYGFNSAN